MNTKQAVQAGILTERQIMTVKKQIEEEERACGAHYHQALIDLANKDYDGALGEGDCAADHLNSLKLLQAKKGEQ